MRQTNNSMMKTVGNTPTQHLSPIRNRNAAQVDFYSPNRGAAGDRRAATQMKSKEMNHTTDEVSEYIRKH